MALLTPVAVSVIDTYSSYVAANLTDSDDATMWVSNTKMPNVWFKLDLGASLSVGSARIVQGTGSDRATQYQIESSDDDSTWTLRYTSVAGLVGGEHVASIGGVTARYWRWVCIAGNGGYGWSVKTVELNDAAGGVAGIWMVASAVGVGKIKEQGSVITGWAANDFDDSGWAAPQANTVQILYGPPAGSSWITEQNRAHADYEYQHYRFTWEGRFLEAGSLEVAPDDFLQEVWLNDTRIWNGNSSDSVTVTIPAASTVSGTNHLGILVQNGGPNLLNPVSVACALTCAQAPQLGSASLAFKLVIS